MSIDYQEEFEVRWADLDPNGHLRHTVYMDCAAQARVGFLNAAGFTLERFRAFGIGPILFREEAQYLHEVRANERLRVTAEISGISSNHKHWRIRHNIYKSDGKLACIVNVEGAWLDLRARKIATPPPELIAAMEQAPRTEDFAEFEPHKPA
ncbi:MAG: acyl-CoA thioesterase [Gammaproteobacteria bacterium]